MNADILLDETLSKKGYQGATFKEKIDQVELNSKQSA
jgi:hypothetical protein